MLFIYLYTVRICRHCGSKTTRPRDTQCYNSNYNNIMIDKYKNVLETAEVTAMSHGAQIIRIFKKKIARRLKFEV
jgi:hypothetical protein